MKATMRRRTKKFISIWMLLAILAFVAWLKKFIPSAGYRSDEAFFEDALVFVIRAGFVLVPASIVYSLAYGRHHRAPPSLLGRKARCFKCKRPIEELTGSKCHFCGWIRCRCGACGCSRGKLV